MSIPIEELERINATSNLEQMRDAILASDHHPSLIDPELVRDFGGAEPADLLGNIISWEPGRFLFAKGETVHIATRGALAEYWQAIGQRIAESDLFAFRPGMLMRPNNNLTIRCARVVEWLESPCEAWTGEVYSAPPPRLKSTIGVMSSENGWPDLRDAATRGVIISLIQKRLGREVWPYMQPITGRWSMGVSRSYGSLEALLLGMMVDA